MRKKIYLGDAVYAEHDGYGVELTTSDGIRNTNTIYLEPEVFDALVRWREEVLIAAGGKGRD